MILDCDIQNLYLGNKGEIEKTFDGLKDKRYGLDSAWMFNRTAYAVFPIVDGIVNRKSWYLVSINV